MSKNKLSKILTKITIIGASIGAFVAIYSQFKKINKDKELNTQNESDQDFDNFDFDKIDKDSREYVSININERKETKTSNDDTN